MNYCYIGTGTIIHLLIKKLFFSLLDGSLLSDTEKLMFLLLKCKNMASRSFWRYMYVCIRTCIGDLIGEHGPICMDEQDRESFSVRARVYFYHWKLFFLFKNFIFRTNKKQFITISFLQFQYSFEYLEDEDD